LTEIWGNLIFADTKLCRSSLIFARFLSRFFFILYPNDNKNSVRASQLSMIFFFNNKEISNYIRHPVLWYLCDHSFSIQKF
jgi:hypothetical protein